MAMCDHARRQHRCGGHRRGRCGLGHRLARLGRGCGGCRIVRQRCRRQRRFRRRGQDRGGGLGHGWGFGGDDWRGDHWHRLGRGGHRRLGLGRRPGDKGRGKQRRGADHGRDQADAPAWRRRCLDRIASGRPAGIGRQRLLRQPLAQRLRQVLRAGITFGRVARHRAQRDRRQLRRHVRAQRVRRHRVVERDGFADLLQRIAVEGLARGEQFVQHRAQRIDVGARVDLAGLLLLGRLVVRRAGDHAFQRRQRRMVGDARDAEVQHLGLVAPRQEDVGRLDVAMHDAARMGIGQRVGDAAHQHGRSAGRGCQPACSAWRRSRPAQPLHRDVHAVGRQAGVVHGDDVRVAQAGGGAGLVEEQRVQRHARGRVDVELQRLHRHHARQQRVPGLEHRAQAALAELLLQRIAADAGQRRLRGGVGFDPRVAAGSRSIREPGPDST